jgi:hypothetical protein
MDRVELYQLRAEECLAMALKSPDEGHLMQSIRMAMYWFDQAEAAARFYHHTHHEGTNPARQRAAA